MPNGSPRSSECIRPSPSNVSRSTSRSRARPSIAAGNLLGRIRLVAGRHGGVGGEHHPLPSPRERLLQRSDAGRTLSAGELERRKAACPSLRCTTAGSIPSAAAHAAAHAQQDILREPRDRVSDVQLRGNPPVDPTVLGHIRVEQEQRHPPHRNPPDLRHDIAPEDRNRDPQRRPVRISDGRREPSGSMSSQYSCCHPDASSRWRKYPCRYIRPTATRGTARSDASFRKSPANPPRPPE